MSETGVGGKVCLSKPVTRFSHFVAQAIEAGHLCGDGDFTKRCEAWLSGYLGSPTLLSSSCTHALEMAAMLLDIGPGDEVIIPSFTFPSTANAFVLRGATPVFADIRPDTLNIDERQVERLITPRTKAIVPVHYAGVACEMDTLIGYSLPIVEDNAHGLFGEYKDKPLGAIGDLGCLSFHVTKNVTSGEGGALIVNNPKYLDRAYTIRDKGTNRRDFAEGKVDKYQWVDTGSSYLMSELQATFLFGQLENSNEIHLPRTALWHSYMLFLDDWAQANGIMLPTVQDDCTPAYHLFYIILPTNQARRRLQQYLANNDIESASHFEPLHSSPMGRQWPAKCPVAEQVAKRLLRLPLYTDLDFRDHARVVKTITKFKA